MVTRDEDVMVDVDRLWVFQALEALESVVEASEAVSTSSPFNVELVSVTGSHIPSSSPAHSQHSRPHVARVVGSQLSDDRLAGLSLAEAG